jgi:hypothetical protein
VILIRYLHSIPPSPILSQGIARYTVPGRIQKGGGGVKKTKKKASEKS